MNKPLAESDFATPKVTTGPIAGSRKVYSAPDAAPDLRVPLREIALSEAAGEEPVRVYDPSGIYTEADAAIDVEKGLKRTRIEWVKERGGVEEYDGRPLQPVDNGNASGKHLARSFPNTPRPLRGIDSSSSPPPLRGRSDREAVREGGRPEATRGPPPPPTPPHKGEGSTQRVPPLSTIPSRNWNGRAPASSPRR